MQRGAGSPSERELRRVSVSVNTCCGAAQRPPPPHLPTRPDERDPVHARHHCLLHLQPGMQQTDSKYTGSTQEVQWQEPARFLPCTLRTHVIPSCPANVLPKQCTGPSTSCPTNVHKDRCQGHMPNQTAYLGPAYQPQLQCNSRTALAAVQPQYNPTLQYSSLQYYRVLEQ